MYFHIYKYINQDIYFRKNLLNNTACKSSSCRFYPAIGVNIIGLPAASVTIRDVVCLYAKGGSFRHILPKNL